MSAMLNAYRLYTHLEALHKKISATPHQIIGLYALVFLLENGSSRASEVARGVGRASTSFTPILDVLQESDLIERQADPEDRRAVLIALTPLGKQTAKDWRLTVEQVEQLIPPGLKKALEEGIVMPELAEVREH